jgi:hypothetical protein
MTYVWILSSGLLRFWSALIMCPFPMSYPYQIARNMAIKNCVKWDEMISINTLQINSCRKWDKTPLACRKMWLSGAILWMRKHDIWTPVLGINTVSSTCFKITCKNPFVSYWYSYRYLHIDNLWKIHYFFSILIVKEKNSNFISKPTTISPWISLSFDGFGSSTWHPRLGFSPQLFTVLV